MTLEANPANDQHTKMPPDSPGDSLSRISEKRGVGTQHYLTTLQRLLTESEGVLVLEAAPRLVAPALRSTLGGRGASRFVLSTY